MREFFKIIENCYESEELPEDFVGSKTILVHKIGDSTECSNYRTITLVSYAAMIHA